jgi:hypothetical protein
VSSDLGLNEAAEPIGMMRPGKLAAVIGPAGTAISVAEAFADIAEIRSRVKPPAALTVKDLMEERPR